MLPQCCKITQFKKVTHVIFDLDGTLIDSETVFNESFQRIAAENGREYTPEIRAKIAGSVETECAKKAVQELKLTMTPEEFLIKYKEYSLKKLKECQLMPGAEMLVRHLHDKGIPIAIATSSNKEEVEIKCQNHKEFFNLFHHIVCAGTDPEVEWGKPNPAVFLVCASRFPDKPDTTKCLVFEDSTNGVKAGIAAGMQVVMVPDQSVPYDNWKLATLRLDSLECMVPELFGLPGFKKDGEEEEEKGQAQEVEPNLEK